MSNTYDLNKLPVTSPLGVEAGLKALGLSVDPLH